MERPLSAIPYAASGAGSGASTTLATRAERIERPVRAAARTHKRASISSPAMTASRCSTSCPTSGSTTWRTANGIATAPTGTRASNWGIEGPTADAEVLELRARAMRSLHGDAGAVPRRPDAEPGRRTRADTAGQQQPVVPGQLRPAGCHGSASPASDAMLAFTRRRARASAALPGVPPARVPPRTRIGRSRGALAAIVPPGHDGGRAGTTGDATCSPSCCRRASEPDARDGRRTCDVLLALNGGALGAQQQSAVGARGG